MTIHQAFMAAAEAVANLSNCRRKQNGAVLVRDNVVIASGYNHAPHDCVKCVREGSQPGHWTQEDTCPVIHAEIDLIANAAKHGVITAGATLYLTYMPCVPCAKAIVQAGIHMVIYRDDYEGSERAANVLNCGFVVVRQFGKDAYEKYFLGG